MVNLRELECFLRVGSRILEEMGGGGGGGGGLIGTKFIYFRVQCQ